jgi:hypothetical protein
MILGFTGAARLFSGIAGLSSPKKSGKRLTPPVKGSNQGFKESFDSA